jgi:hypothetical protein
MVTAFAPVVKLELFCRFCKKTHPAQLERSIAGTGKVLDRDSSYEYVCSRCHRPHCFFGKDIIGQESDSLIDGENIPRVYKITDHFLVGEKIIHPSYKSVGKVVGKDPGKPARLVVKFERSIALLVEDIN